MNRWQALTLCVLFLAVTIDSALANPERMRASWEAVTTDVDGKSITISGYNIYITHNSEVTVIKVEPPRTFAIIHDLKPGPYTIQVTALRECTSLKENGGCEHPIESEKSSPVSLVLAEKDPALPSIPTIPGIEIICPADGCKYRIIQ